MSTTKVIALPVLGAALLLGLLGLAPSCATEEPVTFADAGQTPNGTPGISSAASSGGSTSSSGGSCTVNMACAVSFKTDIYAAILDGAGSCTKNGCHATGTANGNMELNSNDAEGVYAELINYTLMPKSGMGGGPYVTPCDMNSRLLCNLAVDGSSSPICGSAMPIGKKLTQMQYDQIAEWIACGAPDN